MEQVQLTRRAGVAGVVGLGAIAAVAIGSLALPSVGSATGDSSTPGTTVSDTGAATSPAASPAASSTPTGSAATPPPTDEEIQFQIDMMIGLVPQDEIEAYYDEQSLESERRVADCMVEAGWEYLPNEFGGGMSIDTSTIEYAQEFGFSVYTTMDPDVQDPFMSEYVDPNQDYVETLSESEINAYYSQQNRCYEETYASTDQFWSNPDVQRIIEDFSTEVNNDPRMVAAERAWAECMDAAGHPYADQDEMYDDWYSQERYDSTEKFWDSEAWLPTSADHAEWQALVDEEISTAVAAAECTPPMNEVREEVSAERREELLEVAQTIDWDAPPVTYPDDEFFYEGTIAVDGTVPGSSGPDSVPGSTEPGIDLSDV